MVLRSSTACPNIVTRLARDASGTVLIYVALLMPVIIGMSALAIDAGRLNNLHTSLQNAADALALAGAAELDRRPTAITRANAAIDNLTANRDKFATTAPATVAIESRRYLKSLPPSDATAIGSGNVAANAAEARFVEVTVAPKSFRNLFPVSLFGQSNTTTTKARAVAGFDAALCKTVPMFICNPFEGSGTSIFDAVKDPAERRRQIKLQLGNGGESQLFPGNYGWLDSPTIGNGAGALRDALAMTQPPACFLQNGLSQRTGNVENANDAINVRFDLWAGPFNSQKGNTSYRPATNVRKGYRYGNGANSACNPDEYFGPPGTTNAWRLGQDSAFPLASGRLGNGIWDFDAYWENNYGAAVAKPTALATASNANLPSRYDVYRAEVGTIGSGAATDLVAMQAATMPNPANRKEMGSPQCYTGGGVSDNPDRRLLYVAIVNCSGLDLRGNSGGPFPAIAFGKFFITQPVANPPQPDAGIIFAELVDLVQPGVNQPNEVAHDLVQLYR